jgi:hypothetical protein
MGIAQTVEIPPNRRLFVDVPNEIPLGRVVLTFSPASSIQEASKDMEYAEAMWKYNHTHKEQVKEKLQKLKGCLGKSAFEELDGAAYQRKIRNEWD